jgi:hypothetical protein
MKLFCLVCIAMVTLWVGMASAGLEFTDYGSGTTSKLVSGAGIWQINWGQGPWTWYPKDHDPMLNSQVKCIFDVHTTAPASISPDLVATLTVAGTATFTAFDAQNPAITTGTMILSGTGINRIDINASRVFGDPATGIFQAAFKALDPKLDMTLVEATGIFAGLQQSNPWQWYWSGYYAAPLIAGMPLQQNIFAVLGGQVPLVGGVAEFVLTGESIPEPTTLVLLGFGAVLAARKAKR